MPDRHDPAAAHRRLIAAVCDDLAGTDFRLDGRTPRADALVRGNRAAASPHLPSRTSRAGAQPVNFVNFTPPGATESA